MTKVTKVIQVSSVQKVKQQIKQQRPRFRHYQILLKKLKIFIRKIFAEKETEKTPGNPGYPESQTANPLYKVKTRIGEHNFESMNSIK